METPVRTAFKAKVVGTPSQEFSKENGGKYVLQNCEILEGPLKGLIVGGTRTLVNASGDTKEPVELNTEVQLYLTRVPSKTDPSKMQNFFEISTGLTASQDDINALLEQAMSSATAGAVAEGTF